jgi:Lipocalin-like domain
MRSLVVLTAALLAVTAATAHADDSLVGAWKLVLLYTEDGQTHQRTATYGEHPTGGIVFTSTGRYVAIATADDRKPAITTAEQAAAFRSMIAYAGQWRVDGDRFIVRVDVAWNPTWVGTEQVRFWKIENGKLAIVSAPMTNPNVPGGTLIAKLELERE